MLSCSKRTSTVTDRTYGRTPVSASMAFRVARFLGAPIDDLLAGRFTPPSTPKEGSLHGRARGRIGFRWMPTRDMLS